MIALFWACVAIIGYVYFGFPLLLASGLLGRRKPVRKGSAVPAISVIIPAHDEESVIEKKLQNVLGLDYPRDRVEVLVGSDGSDDRTEDIVRRYAPEGARLIAHPQQRGKSATQNELVAQSSGEILVFTDADCLLARDAVSQLVENFADPRVGLVTAGPVYLNTSETDVARNEGLYWRYETWLRQQESDRGLLAMASGWLLAVRRSLWKPLGPDVGDDFVLPLQVALQGRRNVIEPRAHAVTELRQKQVRSMLGMKMRIVSKDLRGLLANKRVLNPLKTGPVAIALFSHKLLRWFVPYFLIGVLVTNLFLLSRPLYRVTMLLQLAFYFSALLAAFLRKPREWSPFSVPLSFCIVNLAALIGTVHCAAGRRVGRWKPARQPGAAPVQYRPGCNQHRHLSIYVLVDALGWRFLERREFLCDLLPCRRPLRTVLGYSSGAIPSILTGLSPSQNGHWNLFYYDPKGSAFRWLRHFNFLPHRVLDHRLFRKLMKEMGRRVLGLGSGFECVVSPRLLPWFNFVERRNIYDRGGIPGARSIFDELADKRIPYRVYTYHDLTDKEILHRALRDIEASEATFFFLYLSEMDSFLHHHCEDGRQLEERLGWYAARLRELFETASKIDPEMNFTVLSDHGMTPVRHHYDLMREVEALKLEMPADYLAVYDSTMARFWFFSDRARREIVECLRAVTCGRILSEHELRELGVLFPDGRFGEVILLLDPGWLLSRSDFHGARWMPGGMHGYHPDDPYSDAIFLSNRQPPFDLRTIADVYQCMWESVAELSD